MTPERERNPECCSDGVQRRPLNTDGKCWVRAGCTTATRVALERSCRPRRASGVARPRYDGRTAVGGATPSGRGIAQPGSATCLGPTGSCSNASIPSHRFSVFSTTWGICFRSVDYPSWLKKIRFCDSSATVPSDQCPKSVVDAAQLLCRRRSIKLRERSTPRAQVNMIPVTMRSTAPTSQKADLVEFLKSL